MKTCAGFFSWLLKDLREMKVLFNWAFLGLFAWVVIWGVLHHSEICLNTAINATSGLAGWIFANYVWGGHMDRRLDMNIGMGTAPTNIVTNIPGDRQPGMDG